MATIELEHFGREIALGAAVSVAIFIGVTVAAFLTRRLSGLIVWTTTRAAKYRLPSEARNYVGEWIDSWLGEMDGDLLLSGKSGFASEVDLLRRVLTLPCYIRSIRNQATVAAAATAPSERNAPYGSILFEDGTKCFWEMDEKITTLTMLWSGELGHYRFVIPSSGTRASRIARLLDVRENVATLSPEVREREFALYSNRDQSWMRTRPRTNG